MLTDDLEDLCLKPLIQQQGSPVQTGQEYFLIFFSEVQRPDRGTLLCNIILGDHDCPHLYMHLSSGDHKGTEISK